MMINSRKAHKRHPETPMLKHLTRIVDYFKPLDFVTASLTKTGGRETNEDRMGWTSFNHRSGYWVVADGLGGHRFGEIAAEIVVKTVGEEYPAHADTSTENIRYLLNQSDLRIMDAQLSTPGGENMASTAVLLMLANGRAIWGHVGDSRLYRFRDGHCECLTSDHSMAQLLVGVGQISAEQSRYHPERSMLLQSLGGNVFRMKITKAEKFRIGDVFLLCSDGFWEYVLEEEMVACLQTDMPLEMGLLQLEQHLLKRVAEQGHQSNYDNYTALVVRIERR